MSASGTIRARHVRSIPNPPARSPLMVPGTLAVAFMIAFGRWGSYLGIPSRQMYLADLLLVVSTAWILVRFRHLIGSAARHWGLLAPVLALTGWALLRFIAGPFSADALRDIAPYGYLSLGVLAAITVTRSALRRTAQILFLALVLHLVWVTASALVGSSLVDRTPLLGGVVHVLELRPDFDGAMLAVLAGTALYAALSAPWAVERRKVLALAVLAIWSTVVVLLLANRAALLALLVAYLVTSVLLAPRLAQVWVRWRGQVVAVGAVAAIMLVVAVPQTPIYARLTGSGSFVQGTASGTTAAREAAWGSVLRYVNQSPQRVAIGVGMGPDFLKASGAWVHYQWVGRKIVRQPHNFVLNTYARLGIVGVLLLGWLVVALSRTSWRLLRSPRHQPVDLTWVLIWTTLLVTSLVGVILEAPFGAIPFGWAAGRVLVSGREHRAGASSTSHRCS